MAEENLEQLLQRALIDKMPYAQRMDFLAKYEGYSGCWLRVLLFLLAMLAVVVTIPIVTLLEPHLSRWGYELLKIAFIVSVIVLSWVPLHWHRKHKLTLIMAGLVEEGVRPHFCLCCEYDLKGSTSEQCPECGTALAPVDQQAKD